MDESGAQRPALKPSHRAVRFILGGTVAVVVTFAVGVYIERGRIAERFARQWLDSHGLASELDVRSLGLAGLTASLRLGDPKNPDLTVDRLDVRYALSGPWNGKPFGVETQSLRLVRPRLKLHLLHGGISFGALQPLIREVAQRAPSGAPPPDVTIEDGRIILSTAGGDMTARVSGQLRGGVLAAMSGAVDPFGITAFGARVYGAGGSVQVSRRGDRLVATGSFGPTRGERAGDRLVAAQAALLAELPLPGRSGRWAGPARLILTAKGVSATHGDARADDGDLSATIAGALDASANNQTFSGALQAYGHLAAFAQTAAHARDATVHFNLTHLSLIRRGARITASGDGLSSIRAGGLAMAGGEMSVLAVQNRISSVQLVAGAGPTHMTATLDGSISGHGAFAEPAARRIAAATPILSGEPPYAAAIVRALRNFQFEAGAWRAIVSGNDVRLKFISPVKVDAASGARLRLVDRTGGVVLGTQGAQVGADIALRGGGLPSLNAQVSNGLISQAGFTADLAVQGALDALFARGAHLEAKGHMAEVGSNFGFRLAACAPVTAERLTFDPNAVTAFAAMVCPNGGPLIEAGPAGWKARGRLEHARGRIASVSATFGATDGTFQAAGHAGRLETAGIVLRRGEVSDATVPIRFQSLTAAGHIGLSHGVWLGAVSGATRAGHSIGMVRIRHDAATGVGRADIDAGGLVFTPNGIQPAELTPLANFAREADGRASFRGWFAWGPGGETTSGGQLVARALKFKSPVGTVLGIDSDIHFTSLSPLVTAPDQTIAIGLVQAITPFSGISAQFDVNSHAIVIDTASGSVAQGRIRLEPIVAPLAAGSIFKGVLVLDHVNLGEILAASSLANTIKMEAVVDGRIPFEVGPSGLTIQQGRLAAIGPGRLSISSTALSGVSGGASSTTGAAGQADFARNLAYQAMENLAFDQLEASVNSLAGERLGIVFHLKGQHDPPQRQRATVRLSDLLGGKVLSMPMPLPSDTKIDLTLDMSLNFGELVRALEQAWRDGTQNAGAPVRSPPVQGRGASVTTK